MANCRTIFTIACSVILFSVNAQILKEDAARRLIQNSTKIWINKHDSTLKYIEFQVSPDKERLMGKLKLEEELKLSSEINFKEINKSTDNLGFEHIRKQQYYKGIPVEGAIYRIHGRDGKAVNANGTYNRIDKFDINPRINENIARQKAQDFTNNKLSNWKSASNDKNEGELVILPIENNYILAYKFDIYSVEPLSRNFVYVNASNGEIVKVEDRIRMEDFTGTAITKYHSSKSIKTEKYNSTYRLYESERGDGIQTHNLAGSISCAQAKDFSDADNFWNTVTNQDDAATSIHYAIEKTFDFFLERFARESYNNNGALIQNYVHYDSIFNNAFWDGDQLFFGDGDGKNYRAFASTDIVAHEFTHAITENTANLFYSGESGALNESFSDIFGIAIDFYANPSTANFIMGDQVSISGTGIRNLAHPKLKSHPDTYKGSYWYTGTADNGGVHANCGVQNYWFYLLSNGGAGTNDLGSTYSITGIGIEKATAIAYRNLTVYLSSNSDFEDARFYSIQSTIDLYGQCSNEVVAVTNAWYAVGVGEAFTSDIDAEFMVSKTSSCSLPFVVNFINKSRNATSFLWNFGDGSVSSEQNPSHSYSQEGNYSVRLVAKGNQLCNIPDTIVKQDIISIFASGLVPSVCEPMIINPSSAGILNFKLGEINNSSALSKDEGGNIDFSCNAQTTLIAGQKIPVTIITNPSSDESVRIWIDINNDGAFTENEKVFSSNAQKGIHTGTIIVPVPNVYNSLLRLRVISDFSEISIQSACFEIQSGQAEDYAVIIQHNNEKPVADFNVTRSLFITGDSVSFNNLSLNIPESYEWSFPGGSPSVSTLKNAKVVYSTPGDYAVRLKAKNAFGEDTKTIEGIVKVREVIIMGSDKTSSEQEGLLFDSGGPSGKYFNNENFGFLINIPCASEIRMAFQMLDLENGCDLIYIYEGTDQTGKLLYPTPGATKYDTLIATSGNVYVHFTSDGSLVKKGFALEWTSMDVGNGPVKADFTLSDSVVSINKAITFNNKSSENITSWSWDLGDGSTSSDQDPVHSYSETGLKNIILIASNCYSSDTIIKQIIVLPTSLSIPDQIIPIDEMKVIDLMDFNINLLEQKSEIILTNSDDNIIQALVNNNQLIINALSLGKSKLTLYLTEGSNIVSDTINVEVVEGGEVDIDEFNTVNSLKVFPNPAREKIYVKLNNVSTSQVEISVFSIEGKQIMDSYQEFSESTSELDIESLKPGLYLIEIKSNGQQFSGKFIRQ
jgi:Zn-dependent metalloprotease